MFDLSMNLFFKVHNQRLVLGERVVANGNVSLVGLCASSNIKGRPHDVVSEVRVVLVCVAVVKVEGAFQS